jgi:hypothetical protein
VFLNAADTLAVTSVAVVLVVVDVAAMICGDPLPDCWNNSPAAATLPLVDSSSMHSAAVLPALRPYTGFVGSKYRPPATRFVVLP